VLHTRGPTSHASLVLVRSCHHPPPPQQPTSREPSRAEEPSHHPSEWWSPTRDTRPSQLSTTLFLPTQRISYSGIPGR
jgi:hypothetical protein